MKRLFALLCAIALLASLAACAAKNDESADASGEADAPSNPVESMSLSEIMDSILADVPDLPAYQPMELTEENFEFFTFVPYAEGYEGLDADAAIGSIAHSVVLVRVPAEDAEDVAAEMEAKADPRKWICVEAEKTVVRQHGDTILLVMSTGEMANAILQNFDALNGMTTPSEDLEIPEKDDDVAVEDIIDQPAAMPGDMPVEDMPTLQPDEDFADGMPAYDPGDGAVEMPNVNPEADVPANSPDVTPVAPAPSDDVADAPAAGADLLSMIVNLYNGVSGVEEIMFGEMELTGDDFEFHSFIPYIDGIRAAVRMPMIGSIAHKVVLVETPEGVDAAKVAADMQAAADPRWLVCVTAESVQTASKGNLAILVMATEDVADTIIANFKAG